jgi:hypothetical protein
MFTAEQSLNLLDTNVKGASSTNFSKVDSQLYSSQLANLKKMGFSHESLKTKYDEMNQIKHPFGVGLGSLPPEIYSGSLGNGSEYINKRIEILNQLIEMFQSAQNPDDLHKIAAFLEMSKKAAGGDSKKAYHYLEAIEAAKVAIKGDSEAEQNFKQYEKSAIYDNISLQKTISELVKRKEHLEAIKNQGYDSYEKYGVLGRISDNGIQSTIQAVTSFGTFKALTNFSRVKDIISGSTKVKNLGFWETGLSCLSKGVKGGFKYGWKALGKCGPWGKFFVLGASVVIAGSKLYTSYNEKDSLVNTVGKFIKDIYYGEATSFTAATASWIIPGFGTIFGTGYFRTEKQKKLEELKTEGAKR